MKAALMFVCLVATWCLLCLAPASAIAQKEKPEDFKARIRATHKIHGTDALQRMENSVKRHKGLKALSDKLSELGFKPEKADKDFYGESAEFEKDQKTFTAEIVVQNYLKPGSKDVAALGTVKFGSPEREEQYHFYLVAPNGDFKRMKEYTVDNAARVLETHSWWTCFRNKLATVGGVCGSAALSCISTSATIPLYLACVGVPCGAAAIKASTCCSCNCKFWCKGICGCCRQ
jgi:hypothetical protein